MKESSDRSKVRRSESEVCPITASQEAPCLIAPWVLVLLSLFFSAGVGAQAPTPEIAPPLFPGGELLGPQARIDHQPGHQQPHDYSRFSHGILLEVLLHEIASRAYLAVTRNHRCRERPSYT
jgi:hypothetical protein